MNFLPRVYRVAGVQIKSGSGGQARRFVGAYGAFVMVHDLEDHQRFRPRRAAPQFCLNCLNKREVFAALLVSSLQTGALHVPLSLNGWRWDDSEQSLKRAMGFASF